MKNQDMFADLSTTLAQELTAATTGNIKVGDASGFPAAGTFTLRTAGEEITVSYVDATTINTCLAQALAWANNIGKQNEA